MQCDEVRDLLSPYLDGELTPEQRLAVDSHLVDCSACATELNVYESISGLAARMVDPVPPPDLWERMDPQSVSPVVATESLPDSVRRSRHKIWAVPVAALARNMVPGFIRIKFASPGKIRPNGSIVPPAFFGPNSMLSPPDSTSSLAKKQCPSLVNAAAEANSVSATVKLV